MDNVKYEISLKNRLLPFLATKEISEILNDIKSDSNENGDLESIYGKSGTFAKEILKDKRKNLDYIIENALIICIMKQIVCVIVYHFHIIAVHILLI